MKSVFISSTFRDMQSERDYLHEKVFPQLREWIGGYGEQIQELDLRWGVDTYGMSDEERDYQVLSVCIDAIDRCRPYIIVLLGERYGWIPGVDAVDALRDERLKGQYEPNMSITNLEIKYGALTEDETLERCIFCFRDPDYLEQMTEAERVDYCSESDVHRQRLDSLKAQICANKKAHIVKYRVSWDAEEKKVTGLEAFGDEILSIMKNLLKKDLGDSMPENMVEQILIEIAGTKESYLSVYTPRHLEEMRLAEGISKMMDSEQDRIVGRAAEYQTRQRHICISGDAGSGKSVFMAAMEEQLSREGISTILYFSGNKGCQSMETLKAVIAYRLEEILELPHLLNPENWNSYLRKLDALIKDRMIVCFIDALDQLYQGKQDVYFNLIEICPNLHFVLSALPTFPWERSMMGMLPYVASLEMGLLTKREILKLIERTAAFRGKKLNRQICEMILMKQGAGNPLYLSMLLQRMFMMTKQEFAQADAMASGMEGIHRYLTGLIKALPETAEEMAVYLLRHTAELFGDPAFERIVCLIGVSETGLTEKELEDMHILSGQKYSPVDFQRILVYLYDIFRRGEDGAWRFVHRLFYEAVEKSLKFRMQESKRIMVEYSAQNETFLQREGYRHVLRERAAFGSVVLENCYHWINRDEVCRLVVELINEDSRYEAYFEQMNSGNVSDGFVRMWRSISADEDGEKAERVKQHILERILEGAHIAPETRGELLLEQSYQASDTELPEIFMKLEKLSSDLSEGYFREYLHLRTEVEKAARKFRMNQVEEACLDQRKILKELEKLSAYPEDKEERAVLYTYMRECFMLEKWLWEKERAVCQELMEQILSCYETYPDIQTKRSFFLLKIHTYEALMRQYLQSGQEKRAEYYGKLALETAREGAERFFGAEAIYLYAKLLRDYGEEFGGNLNYQYQYESMQMSERVFRLNGLDFWKQIMARQAGRAACEIHAGKQKLGKGWTDREIKCWDLCLRSYEDLYRQGYAKLNVRNYADYLLERSEYENEKDPEENGQVLQLAKRAYRLLEEEKTEGFTRWDVLRRYRAAYLIAGYYIRCYEEKKALPYGRELLLWTKKLCSEDIPSEFDIQLAYRAYALAAWILYYNREDKETLEVVEEGITATEQSQNYNPGENVEDAKIKFTFLYVKARVYLEKGQTECVKKLMQEYNKKFLSKRDQLQWELLMADVSQADGEFSEAAASLMEVIQKLRDEQDAIALFYVLYAKLRRGDALLAADLPDKRPQYNYYCGIVTGNYGENIKSGVREYVEVMEICAKGRENFDMLKMLDQMMNTAWNRVIEAGVEQEIPEGFGVEEMLRQEEERERERRKRKEQLEERQKEKPRDDVYARHRHYIQSGLPVEPELAMEYYAVTQDKGQMHRDLKTMDLSTTETKTVAYSGFADHIMFGLFRELLQQDCEEWKADFIEWVRREEDGNRPRFAGMKYMLRYLEQESRKAYFPEELIEVYEEYLDREKEKWMEKLKK